MKVDLPRPQAAWVGLRAAQVKRARVARDVVPAGSLRASDAGRRFWSQRTWSEYAAIPAVSQAVLALVREGASLEVVGAYTTIAQDEARHAVLSRDLADRLGGYVDEVPAGLDYAPRGLAQPSDVPALTWALANGCFSETVSLALIRARHAATTNPVVRLVLAETMKDEALHVRVAWQVAGEVLPSLAPAHRRDLGWYGEELAELLRRSFGTAGLPPRVRTRERRLRDEAARNGAGCLPAAQEDALVDTALEDIAGRLQALGVSAR